MYHHSTPNMDMDRAMNKYFHENVQLAEQESQKYRNIAFPIIKSILQYINSKDPRFSRQPFRAGSYWQGLKVDKADEYDISVILDHVGPLHWSSYTPRYYGFNRLEEHPTDTLSQNLEVVKCDVPLPPPPEGYCTTKAQPQQWAQRHDLIFEGDIVPFLVKRRLKQVLTWAIRDLNLRDKVHQSRKAHGPALTLYITSGKKEISIDFAPLIQGRLPFTASFGWPRTSGTSWPDANKVQRIKEIGIGEVAKKDFYWLISFAEAEKELVKEIDKDGGKRKQVHRIMKMLNIEEWSNTSKPVISSYMLKNLWWWECEQYPGAHHWDNEHLWTRMESLTRELLRCVRARHLRQYFYPDMNLMGTSDEDQMQIAAQKIEDFLADPLRYMDSPIPA